MSATLVTAAAAGWYHDPSDSGSWRWWDGATWTSHVRPKQQTTPIAVAAPVSEAIVLPVQPAPAPQIPQPAQPIQPIQPVSMTPETPASEQEYWHSPNAEVIRIPGRSATAHGSHFRQVGPGGHSPSAYDLTHDWGDVGSPQTAGIWLLAFLPIIAFALLNVMLFGLQAMIGPDGAVLDPIGASQKVIGLAIAYVLILVMAAWIFAGRDIKMLRTRGYNAPSIWWMLVPLSPLAYFIARGKVVRKEGKRAWPPELLFFLSIVIPIVLSVLGTIFAMSILASLAGSAGVPL